jgi:hypothetical protein
LVGLYDNRTALQEEHSREANYSRNVAHLEETNWQIGLGIVPQIVP